MKSSPGSPLEVLQVASPCAASWDAMKGDARVRFCDACRKNVYNLSELPRADAEALLQKAEGKLCVRFYRRLDGTVLTAGCPVGLRAALKRRLRRLRRVAALVFGLWAASSYLPAIDHRPAVSTRWRPPTLATLREWIESALRLGAPGAPTMGKVVVMGEPAVFPVPTPACSGLPQPLTGAAPGGCPSVPLVPDVH